MSVSTCFIHQVMQSETQLHHNSTGSPSLIDLVLYQNINVSQLGSCSNIPPLATSDQSSLHLVINQPTLPVWEAGLYGRY